LGDVAAPVVPVAAAKHWLLGLQIYRLKGSNQQLPLHATEC